jgi:hypothetical protein
MKGIPPPAFILGWAGVIPFAALTVMTLTPGTSAASLHASAALQALVAYGMIILSFMGGVQWGLEMTRTNGAAATGFAASVLPALAAFAASFASTFAALLILIGGFVALLAYDMSRLRAGIGPAWYGTLRLQLSSAVVLCLTAAAVASIGGIA